MNDLTLNNRAINHHCFLMPIDCTRPTRADHWINKATCDQRHGWMHMDAQIKMPCKQTGGWAWSWLNYQKAAIAQMNGLIHWSIKLMNLFFFLVFFSFFFFLLFFTEGEILIKRWTVSPHSCIFTLFSTLHTLCTLILILSASRFLVPGFPLSVPVSFPPSAHQHGMT